MLKKYQGKLYCFSPPVMLATFLIEFGTAFYTFWRYKINTVGRLLIAMLLALGTFQLAEYMLCGGLGLSNVEWARIGYMAITLLPPLGIHVILELSNKKKPILLGSAYASCAIFFGFYMFSSSSVVLEACLPNYAIFSAYRAITIPFALYYYSWLIIGTCLALHWSKELPKHREALRSMAVGYLVFILPTTTVNILSPSTVSGIPSIMCGFAILLTFVIATKVLPKSCENRNKSFFAIIKQW